MPDEVAVFIDVENLRYGLLNHHGTEPDFQSIVVKAQKYGRPSVMRAYADFSEHPTTMNRQLQVAGIEAIHIPVKRTMIPRGQTQVERVKNAADMVLALDALVEAYDADSQDKKKTFLIVYGRPGLCEACYPNTQPFWADRSYSGSSRQRVIRFGRSCWWSR